MAQDNPHPCPLPKRERELYARVIIVHTLEQVMAALEAATSLETPVALQSAPGAIYYAGGRYLLNMFEQGKKSFPQAEAIFILDCGDAAAEAVAALGMGHSHLRSCAPEALRTKIASIAEQRGTVMISGDYESLDLIYERDPAAACKKWLAGIKDKP